MKFICQNCSREFDIGAPKGLQLPCPACGGMLADEESAGGAPQAQPVPEPELSFDAAESYASAPAEPEAQEEYQAEAASQEPAAQYQEEAYQEEYQEEEYQETAPEVEAPAEPASSETDDESEMEEEEEEEEVEAEASPVIVWMGWILFVIAFAGILVMAYFLMLSHNLAEEGRKAGEVRQENERLQRQLREQTDLLLKQQASTEELEKKSAELAGQVTSYETRIAELTKVSDRYSGSSERLQGEFERTAKALGEARVELQGLRDRAESAEISSARAVRRLTAITQALRAVDLVYVPGRWAEALGYLESSIAADDQLDIAWWMRGRILVRAGQLEEAIAAFERVDQIARESGAKGNARALHAAAEVVRLAVRNNRRAAEIYQKAAETAPDSPFGVLSSLRHLALTGGEAVALGRLPEAIEKTEAAGGDASGLLLLKAELLASAAGSGGDGTGDALEAVSRVIAGDPNHIPALDLRSELLLRNDDKQAAVIDIMKAAELDPADGRRLVKLGRLLVDLGRMTTAEPVLRRAVEALPASVEAKLVLGRALVELNRFDDAVAALADVLHLDGNNAEAFRLRGRARVALHRYREGLHDLEESLRLGQDDAAVRILLARTYASAQQSAFRNVTKSIENAQAAVQLTNSRDAEALATLASAYAAGGDFARAQVEIRRAIRLSPENESYAAALRAYERRQGGL